MSNKDKMISNLERVTSKLTIQHARGQWLFKSLTPIALLFTDIENFTAKSLAIGAPMIGIIGQYFGRMSESIYASGGDIDKFIGDAIFAYFFNVDDPAQAANSALDAVLDMSDKEESMVKGKTWKSVYKDKPEWKQHEVFKTRFGLHWGTVIAGEFGSRMHGTTTFIGDNVNLAQRMESLNKQYNSYILLSGDFVMNLSADRQQGCRQIDYISVSGREGTPLNIYTFDRVPLPEIFLSGFKNSLQNYFDGDWHEARLGLIKAQKTLIDHGFPEDGPTRALINRIEEVNLFWRKAVTNLATHASEFVTPELVSLISGKLEKRKYTAPMNWPGYWRADK